MTSASLRRPDRVQCLGQLQGRLQRVGRGCQHRLCTAQPRMLAAQGTLDRGQGPQQLGMVRVPVERCLKELQGLVGTLLGAAMRARASSISEATPTSGTGLRSGPRAARPSGAW
jgi:hypothetical protein